VAPDCCELVCVLCKSQTPKEVPEGRKRMKLGAQRSWGCETKPGKQSAVWSCDYTH